MRIRFFLPLLVPLIPRCCGHGSSEEGIDISLIELSILINSLDIERDEYSLLILDPLQQLAVVLVVSSR